MSAPDISFLASHITANSQPLDPVATLEVPSIRKLESLKAVVFDIYGTLFISGCGDISLIQKEDRSPSLCAALATSGYTVLDETAPWSATFMESMESFREMRLQQGIEFPEVRIEEVWQTFISTAQSRSWLSGNGNLHLAIVDYECRVNPCWPMPHLQMLLETLQKRGIPLGIVSNAQFYTPLLFSSFLGTTPESSGFINDYCVWSYKEREGKPSRNLYQTLKNALKEDGISPGDVLYVGNDLRNDIWPAQELGFHTALFAGDNRSLRWRRDDPSVRDVRPDMVLTDLTQVLDVII